MSVEFNPREVLDILRSMGYVGITKDQLKLFMKDLKKLIKYDRKKQASLEKTDRATSPLKFNDEATPQPPPDEFEQATTGLRERYRRLMTDINRMAPSPSPTREKPPPETDPDKFLRDDDMACSSCGGRRAGDSKSKEESTSNGSDSSNGCNCCSHRGCTPEHHCGTKKKKDPPPSKPCPSFIRSKSANERYGGGGGRGKSDPVTLHQYYQDLWSRQNLPGENPRSDLRWRIRHKMLGPRPQSKIVTSATNRENPPWID